MPVNAKEVKRRLTFLLKEEDIVNEYIRTYGPVLDIKNIKAIKAQFAASTSDSSEIDEEQKGEDPIYEISLVCPICTYDKVKSYQLKAKSQQITQNIFLQDEYFGAAGHRTVDYNRLAVTVCPRCLFASPDKKDYNSFSAITKKTTQSQLQSNTIQIIQEKIGDRKAIGSITGNADVFFEKPRKDDAVILSYKLAVHRAQQEWYYELPNSLYKLAAYELKIATVLQKKGEDAEENLSNALEYFTTCFQNSNVTSEVLEYKVLYTIIALNLYLNKQNEAQSFIAVFDKLNNKLKNDAQINPSVNLTHIQIWRQKAKMIWEDRDREDLFN